MKREYNADKGWSKWEIYTFDNDGFTSLGFIKEAQGEEAKGNSIKNTNGVRYVLSADGLYKYQGGY